MNSVTTAQMAIYAIMIIPVLYLLVKHGRPGIMGWLYFAAFCMLRILGGALALSGSESATIIGNIGLSPLLLAACGILHESYVDRAHKPMDHSPTKLMLTRRPHCRNRLRRSENPKLEWPLVMTFHLLIAGATAILAVGASALQDSSPTPSDLKKVQVGIAILAAGWAILLGWTAQSWFRPGNTQNMEASRAGKQVSIAYSLPSAPCALLTEETASYCCFRRFDLHWSPGLLYARRIRLEKGFAQSDNRNRCCSCRAHSSS